MSVIRDELTKQSGLIEQKICHLAYQRLGLSNQIDRMDKDMANLEAQHSAFGVALSALATDEAVAAAKVKAEPSPVPAQGS